MKQQYRVRNWSEYNLALRQRGSLTFWVNEDVIDSWLNINPTKTFGISDAALRLIRKRGRKQWKRESDYHRRSLAETAIFRHERAFGGKVQSRKFENQATELLCQCAMLNQMIQLGKPVSVPVAA